MFLDAKTLLPTKKIIQLATNPNTPHIEDEDSFIKDVVALLCDEEEAGTLLLVHMISFFGYQIYDIFTGFLADRKIYCH